MTTLFHKLELHLGGLQGQPLKSGPGVDTDEKFSEENLTTFGRFAFMSVWLLTLVTTIAVWYWIVFSALPHFF